MVAVADVSLARCFRDVDPPWYLRESLLSPSSACRGGSVLLLASSPVWSVGTTPASVADLLASIVGADTAATAAATWERVGEAGACAVALELCGVRTRRRQASSFGIVTLGTMGGKVS